MKSSQKMKQTTIPEWSHRADIESIGKTPVRTTISASPQERKDLARRFGVTSVDSLKAEIILQREPGSHVISVEGRLEGMVTQRCVVTFDPVHDQIEESFTAWYADYEQAMPLAKVRRERESMMAESEIQMAEEEDDPEPVLDGKIDLGELATQHFALAISAYPHAEGVSYNNYDNKAAEKGKGSPVRQNPFAGLKDWKYRKDKEK